LPAAGAPGLGGLSRLDAALIALIAVGVVLLLVPARRRPPAEAAAPAALAVAAPPAPQVLRIEPGIEVSRFDVPALQQWCEQHGLPAPPQLAEAEPQVGRTVHQALLAAAAQPGAASYGRMGMISASLACYESAAEYFRRAAAADPAVFRWRYYIGCIQQTLGEADSALATFEQARRLDPGYAMTYGRMAEIHLWAGRHEQAAEYFRQYIAREPNDSLGFVGLARIALQEEDYARALEHAEAGRARTPRDFQVSYCLARAYAGLGREDDARKALDFRAELKQGGRLEARDPLHAELRASTNSAASLVEQLPSLSERGDWQQLAAVAEQIVARRPGDVPMLANLAGYYRKLGRFADAHAVLDRAESHGSDTLLVRLTRAELLLAERRFPQAAETARQALSIDPGSARALSIAGRAEYMLGDLDAAAEALTTSVAIEPDVGNLFVLGEVLRAAGRKSEAAAAYRRMLELAPDDARARQGLDAVGQHAIPGQAP
jgi:tetratricopeptide (TPR) repeat protein